MELQKATQHLKKMALVSPYMAIITLNINLELHSLIEKQIMARWIKKKQTYGACCL